MSKNKNMSMQNISEKLENISHETMEKVDGVVKLVQSHASDYTETVEDYIQKYPIQSVGIAMAVGVLLGSLIRVREALPYKKH